MSSGYVPECLKIGSVTTVYKNKGSRNEASNFRGITVLPVTEKILEIVLKQRIVPTLEKPECCPAGVHCQNLTTSRSVDSRGGFPRV
ncbi:hypothetical protein DPMN_168403 [Dreissena polymorpha]|uniref:Uncharacterized protein n=1 Tax=Dreissena polymorpha TaxID=45954 RepID=A0A9D4IZK2_DREPO|nr:hypothetical protein DPMN_168403 [Dreissena polymorpha]